MRLLTVNAGSSSLKVRVIGEADELVDSTDVRDWDGDPAALDGLLRQEQYGAVVHRVVHGGVRFTDATVVDEDTQQGIADLVSLAPLHQPIALKLIAYTRAASRAPTVACFDTAFHRTLPDAAATYALPQTWRHRWGLRRFGFHGLSHEYAARRTAEMLDRPATQLRLVSCHLGAGASVCAIAQGESVDTSMGFTPLEGLVMAKRSGSVDPGLLVWLLTEAGVSHRELGDALEHKSGLTGLCGGHGDMQDVLRLREQGDQDAGLAFDVYVHRLSGEIARMAAAMGGVDAITFTGGVGEHHGAVREAALRQLRFLGVDLDAVRNAEAQPDTMISPEGATVSALVVTSREDLQMARAARAVLG